MARNYRYISAGSISNRRLRSGRTGSRNSIVTALRTELKLGNGRDGLLLEGRPLILRRHNHKGDDQN